MARSQRFTGLNLDNRRPCERRDPYRVALSVKAECLTESKTPRPVVMGPGVRRDDVLMEFASDYDSIRL